MYIFIGVIIVLLSIYVAIGWHFSTLMIKPKTLDHDFAYNYDLEREKFNLEYWNGLEKEEVSIQSQQGYQLYGIWLKNPNATKTVIICHGIRWNLMGSIKYVHLFYDRGYNVLLFDNRNHGRSGGTTTSFGRWEKEDLAACTDFVESKMGKGAYVGTLGESLGAASVLQHLGIDPRVKFCIADCPYSDLKELLEYRLHQDYPHIKLPILPMASLFTNLRAGFAIHEVSPIESIRHIKTPVFFIHGLEDDYILPKMSEDMYRAKAGKNSLWLVPHADHAASFHVDQQAYNERVGSFLEKLTEE